MAAGSTVKRSPNRYLTYFRNILLQCFTWVCHILILPFWSIVCWMTDGQCPNPIGLTQQSRSLPTYWPNGLAQQSSSLPTYWPSCQCFLWPWTVPSLHCYSWVKQVLTLAKSNPGHISIAHLPPESLYLDILYSKLMEIHVKNSVFLNYTSSWFMDTTSSFC